MTIKLTISFEFDDDAFKKLDSDLLRCIIFTNLPKLSLSNNDNTQDWGEIGHTEWKKIRKIIDFEKIMLLNHDELKIQIESMTLDLKRTRTSLGIKSLKLLDQETFLFIRDVDGYVVGKLFLQTSSFNDIIQNCFRFKSNSGWIIVNVKESKMIDSLKTQKMLLSSLISYSNHIITNWKDYPSLNGCLNLIRDSLLCGFRIRMDKCQHWLENIDQFQIMESGSENMVYETLIDIDGVDSCQISTIFWNFSWIKEQSRIWYHSDAANLAQIFIKQSVSHLSDILKRKVFAIQNEIKKIELAASLGSENFDIVYKAKTNLYEICIEINELVSVILLEISKNQDIPASWTEDISLLMTTIHVQILPNLCQSSKVSQIPFGKILNQVTNFIHELILRVERILKIQLTYLTESPFDGRLTKRAWWSGLLYEKEFMTLLQIISLMMQRMIQNFLIHEADFTGIFNLIFKTGFLFVLYSDIQPDNNSIGMFEDLFYRLQEIRMRIRLRFHSQSELDDVKFKINPLYIIMSFPLPDRAYSWLTSMNLQRSNLDITPLLFIPKDESIKHLFSDDDDQKKADLSSRIFAINDATFTNLDSYVQKITRIEHSSNYKSRRSLGNNIHISLKLLKSEIYGTSIHYYAPANSKDLQLTLLANRCIREIGISLANNYSESSEFSLLIGVWMQDGSTKSTFHHGAIAQIEESFGIFIDRNLSKD